MLVGIGEAGSWAGRVGGDEGVSVVGAIVAGAETGAALVGGVVGVELDEKNDFTRARMGMVEVFSGLEW